MEELEGVSPAGEASATPRYEPFKEIRLAVVIYGGVSLAIYINGIIQEMLRFVRATAPGRDSASGLPFVGSPQSSEIVYRKLGQIVGDPNNKPGALFEQLRQGTTLPIRTRFVIDVLSGTSAGGINAVFLAKALANDQDVSKLQELWISSANIEDLINDRQSLTRRLSTQSPPPSLLNGRKMYMQLLDALDGMGDDPGETSPLVDDLDLFTTTTDIRGLTLPIVLTDGMVLERRHRNVFHFQHSSTGKPLDTERNAFGVDSNPFLAYAARCTSAFPFAFEPMQFGDIFDILQTAPKHFDKDYARPDTLHWKSFYKDYLQTPQGAPRPVAFQFQSFGDGGYLDNKPFSYAIDAILTRHSALPVERKLVYIEPSPEQLSAESFSATRPDALENSLAALLVLPRYETIREDLERILKRNVEIERLARVVREAVESERQRGREPSGPDSGEDPGGWLGGTVEDYGATYATYEALKLSSVTDQLADLLAAKWGIDRNSAFGEAVRTLASEWRRLRYKGFKSGRDFLLDFDIDYRLRRIRYLRRRLQEEYFDATKPPAVPEGEWSDYRDDYREELRRIKAILGKPYRDLQQLSRNPVLPPDMLDKPVFTEAQMRLVTEPPADEELVHWNGLVQKKHAMEASDRGSRVRAEFVLDTLGGNAKIDALSASLKQQYKDATVAASKAIKEEFKSIAGLREGTSKARAFASLQYRNFERYDSAAYPITFGTNLDDSGPVSVHRISPDDANARRDDVLRGHPKLRGHAIGAFGGFLDKQWRRNDILWGRLDGAERLIEMVLPGSDQATLQLRSKLIDEAHQEIVSDFLDKPAAEWKQALREFLSTVPEEPDPQLVARSAARATAVVGELLEGIADKRGPRAKPVFRRLAFFGRLAWNFVEVSVPRTWRELLGDYWLKLLMLFSGLLVVIAVFSQQPAVIGLAASFTVATALIGLARSLLMRFMRGLIVLGPGALVASTVLVAGVLAAVVIALPSLLTVAVKSPTPSGQAFAELWGALGHLGNWLFPLMGASLAVALISGMLTSHHSLRARQLATGGDVVRRLKFAKNAADVRVAFDMPADLAAAAVPELRAAQIRVPPLRAAVVRALRFDDMFAASYALVLVTVGIAFHGIEGGDWPAGSAWAMIPLGVAAAISNVIANTRAIDLMAWSLVDNPNSSPPPPAPHGFNVAKWIALAATGAAFGGCVLRLIR
jgi:patatin-related protein